MLALRLRATAAAVATSPVAAPLTFGLVSPRSVAQLLAVCVLKGLCMGGLQNE
jgi:hypothetical protein